MFYPELKGTPLAAYNATVQALKAKAMRELGLPETEIVVRPLRPDDFEINRRDFQTSMAADAWTRIIDSKTIADNRYVGICGVYNNEGPGELVELKITRKGEIKRYWNIIPIRGWEHKTGWVDDPFTVDQNTQITVEGYATTASTITDWALLGVAVEKRGLLVA